MPIIFNLLAYVRIGYRGSPPLLYRPTPSARYRPAPGAGLKNIKHEALVVSATGGSNKHARQLGGSEGTDAPHGLDQEFFLGEGSNMQFSLASASGTKPSGRATTPHIPAAKHWRGVVSLLPDGPPRPVSGHRFP